MIAGLWHQAVGFPLAVISIDGTSAGTTWSIFASDNVAGTLQGDGSTCAAGADATGWNWASLCSSSAGDAVTQLTVSEFAGDVTYHSDVTCRQTSSFYDCTDGYTWNVSGGYTAGTAHALEGFFSAHITVSDAAGVSLAASPIIPVQAYSVVQDQPLTCTLGSDGARDCTAQHYSENGTQGSVGE
jgi:hypothetical protein